MAQRRITDASTKPYAKDRLASRTVVRARRHRPRVDAPDALAEQLAAVLDQPPYEPVTGVEDRRRQFALDRSARRVAATQARRAGHLALLAPEEWEHGIQKVRLTRANGDIRARADERHRRDAHAARTAVARHRPPRRTLRECLAEELRRLDPDLLYGRVITEGWELGPATTSES
jgi:hypothetical protein